MQTITLQIDADTAAAYEAIDGEGQKELQKILAETLKHQLKLKSLFSLMDKMGAEAEANGLTPEILESILADEN